jgi:DNA-binding NarL/FixJ family response regulator/predicted ATPase
MTASSVIGRESEVARVLDALADGDRWITLVGPGGVGKTTVARVVQRQLAAQGGAALFVSCEKWVDAVSLLSLIAEEIGGDPSALPAVSIAQVFARGDTVVVLDNIEHLSDAFGELCDLVASDERIRLVTTSRIAARLSGETVHHIEPLGECALELLADRIETAGVPRPDSSDPALSELCDLVDRLPLGIELAAARVPTFGLSGLIDVLSASYRALDQHRPHRRHNSVIDAVAETYHLIDSPDTRRLYRHLGVFSSSFTLAAAKAMHGEASLATSIGTLVELQLLVRDSEVPTYRMLATVREHARELLRDNGERSGAHQLLLQWADEVTANELVDVDGEHPAWLARVGHNYPAIRDGLALAAADSNSEWVTRLVERLRPYWLPLQLVREAHSWARLSQRQGYRDPIEQATQLFHLAVFGYFVEGPRASLRYAQRGLDVDDLDHGTKLYGRLLDSAARAATELGDFQDAVVWQRQAIELYDHLSERWLHAGGLVALGRVELARGAPTEAVGYFKQAMTSYDDQGKIRSMASTKALLAEARRQAGDADGAVMLLDDSIAAQLAVDDRTTAVEAMVWRIEALADGGHYELAQQRSQELIALVGPDNLHRHASVLAAVLRAEAPTLANDELVRRTWAIIVACLDTASVVALVGAIELAGELATAPTSRVALMAAANGWRAKYSMRRPQAAATRLRDVSDIDAVMTDRDDLARCVAHMFSTANEASVDLHRSPDGNDDGVLRSLSLVQPLVDALTPRELEVLELVAKGLRDKEIATRLYLSVRTVNGYVARVFTKLDATSRLGAVNAARRLGLIDGGLVSAS